MNTKINLEKEALDANVKLIGNLDNLKIYVKEDE